MTAAGRSAWVHLRQCLPLAHKLGQYSTCARPFRHLTDLKRATFLNMRVSVERLLAVHGAGGPGWARWQGFLLVVHSV